MSNKSARYSLFLCTLLVVSYLLPELTAYSPVKMQLDDMLIAPSVVHPFGTDELGRDVMSRVLHGFATTVTISLAAMISSLLIGAAVGAVAGYYYETWPDKFLSWLINLIVSLPFLLIVASLLSLTHPSIEKAYGIITAIIWVNPARIVRAEVLKTISLDYVTASRALGSPEWRILGKTVLPGCLESAIIFSVSYLPELVALEAGLSFLGLGVQPPDPGLGKMIFEGLNYIYSAWWISLFPGAVLSILVLFINIVLRIGGGDESKCV
jgi:peptide/nickel transport system permease protein